MKIYNIENINNKIKVGDEIEIKMVNNKKDNIKKLKILDYCGEGGYGTVFKCDLNGVECVIKFSTNESEPAVPINFFSSRILKFILSL